MKYKITYTVTETGSANRSRMVAAVSEIYELPRKWVRGYSDQKLLDMYFAHNADEPGEFLADSCGDVDFKVEKV